MADITSFHGERRWLSNFWESPCEFEGTRYPSSEHAYQAAKFLSPVDRRAFRTGTPGQAKRRGRGGALRQDWERVKLDVMLSCLRSKFTLSADLRRRLLATGDAKLVEGNTWGDRFWGVCRGQGANHLGRLLMQVREEIRAGILK